MSDKEEDSTTSGPVIFFTIVGFAVTVLFFMRGCYCFFEHSIK